jgi:hypothetical protein
MRLVCLEKIWSGYGCQPIDIASPLRSGSSSDYFVARATLMRNDDERAREWPRCGTVHVVRMRSGKMRVVYPR